MMGQLIQLGESRGRVLTAVLLALLSGACKPDHSHQVAVAELPSVPVRVQPAKLQNHSNTESVVGTVRPKVQAKVEAKISGRIEQMLVGAGQSVSKGDLLAVLEAREIQAQLDQANAVQENAQTELNRYRALLQQGAATETEFDAVLTRQRVAEATVQETETMLSQARVTAPFSGVITRKHLEVGDSAAPGKPLLELEDPTRLRVEMDLPESLMNHVRHGLQCTVYAGSSGGQINAEVSEIAPVADPATRTRLVKLDLPSQVNVRSGQFVRVSVPVGEQLVLTVPSAALLQRGQLQLVFVVDQDRAQLRIVRTGKRLDNEIELLSGLEEGERVVVEGADQLREGQPLEIRR